MADNYIVIQDWMVDELKLKGNELIIYACIYGFSQAEGQTFHGSLSYLGKWAGIKNRNNVLPPLKSLIDKGLIDKQDRMLNGVKYCEYAAKYNGVMKSITGCYENHNGCYEIYNGGVMKSITNNIDNNINNTLKDNIGKVAPVYYPNDELLNAAFVKYVSHRKKLKAPLTDDAVDLVKKKLEKLSGGDNDKAIAILEQSVREGWKGIFVLHDDKGSGGGPFK